MLEMTRDDSTGGPELFLGSPFRGLVVSVGFPGNGAESGKSPVSAKNLSGTQPPSQPHVAPALKWDGTPERSINLLV